MKLLGFLLGALLGIGLIAGGLWWLARPGAEPSAAAHASATAQDHGPITPLTAAELAVPPRHPPVPDGAAAADEPEEDERRPAEPAPPAQTYTLWRPFSSRAAAEGFARQICEQADIAVEVRQQGDAAFEVVLPYRDEKELATMVRAIEDATRLEIR